MIRPPLRTLLAAVVFTTLLHTHAAGDTLDWPQFLGPTRNGTCAGTNLAESWPKDGPPIVWRTKVGEGFSGPVVSVSKLILFHRLEKRAVVDCLDIRTGQPVWRYEYRTDYVDDFGFDEGPRATPAIAGGFVYTFGAEGTLNCLSMASGKRVWNVDTRLNFQASKGFFGAACSPLVEGQAVLLNVGGANGSGIVAFNKDTGEVLWKATDAEASYSSPCAATINGRRLVFFFTRGGLVSVDPGTGKVQHEFPWRSRMRASVNAASPLIIDDLVFLSASYQTGAVLLRVSGETVEKLWSADEVLSNHYATSVYHDGFLYGFDGRQEQGPHLRCVELKTGKVRWSQDNFGAGTVTLAGQHLIVLRENGELILAPASPNGFKAIARAQVLPGGVRACPALADRWLYARSKDALVCVDLRGRK